MPDADATVDVPAAVKPTAAEPSVGAGVVAPSVEATVLAQSAPPALLPGECCDMIACPHTMNIYELVDIFVFCER